MYALNKDERDPFVRSHDDDDDDDDDDDEEDKDREWYFGLAV